MDDMTPEEFYEFMGLIRDLRFNGVDTKPEEVENKTIRLAWRCIRPSIIKSTRNARVYEGRKQKKLQTEQEEVSMDIPTCDISSEEKLIAEEETPPQFNSQKPQQNDVYDEIFDTPEDLARYLIQVKREKGKLAMEYKMNTLPRNNGFSWKEVYDIYKNYEE